jgi:hypothetical protein
VQLIERGAGLEREQNFQQARDECVTNAAPHRPLRSYLCNERRRTRFTCELHQPSLHACTHARTLFSYRNGVVFVATIAVIIFVLTHSPLKLPIGLCHNL